MNNKKKMYILGFLLSIFLTIFPFFLVSTKIFSINFNLFGILFCSIIQILVHFIYFLELDFSKTKRWNIVSFLFVMVIIFIIFFGSIWIMYNLNHHMLLMN